MRGRLLGISSPDLPSGPGELPADPLDCWVVVQADIGPDGEKAADTFTFYVTTPKRLGSILEHEGIQEGRHLLIVEAFDWPLIERRIRRFVEAESAATWGELAHRLGRHGLWEYEDYREADPLDR